jgi:hypothetical protein
MGELARLGQSMQNANGASHGQSIISNTNRELLYSLVRKYLRGFWVGSWVTPSERAYKFGIMRIHDLAKRLSPFSFGELTVSEGVGNEILANDVLC